MALKKRADTALGITFNSCYAGCRDGPFHRDLVSTAKQMPPQSMMLQYTPGNPIEARKGAVNMELCLAKALKEFLGDSKCQHRVIAIAQKCLQDYAPLGYEYTIGMLNPSRFFRQRSQEIKELITNLRQEKKELTPILIKKFLYHGAWNQKGYLTEPSANVILVSQLCLAVLEEFKTQLSLKQLRNHDLLEVCYAVEKKNWNLEDSAKKIYDRLH